jgi:hypothetical protein
MYPTKYAEIETKETIGYRECGDRNKHPTIVLIHGGC